jgi:hypothetical protein
LPISHAHTRDPRLAALSIETLAELAEEIKKNQTQRFPVSDRGKGRRFEHEVLGFDLFDG